MTSAQQCLLTVQLSSGERPIPQDFVPHLVAAPLEKVDGPVFAFEQQPLTYNQVAGLWQLAFIAPQNAGKCGRPGGLHRLCSCCICS